MVFMKTTARIITLLLALMMVVTCFIGCKGDENTDDPSVTTTTAGGAGGEGGEGGDVTTEYVSKLPQDKKFEGEPYQFNILGVDGGTHQQFTTIEIARDTLTGNVVGDAVYYRNEELKAKHNFEVKQTLSTSVVTVAQNLYLGGEHLYDVVDYYTVNLIKHAQEGYLLDLNTVPYIDFLHPAWDDVANAELTINGKTYLAHSDFNLQSKARTYFMMYNRELFHTHEEYQGVYIEDMVDDNTWTVEKFYEIANNEFAADLDGGGKGGLLDQWALCADGHNVMACFAYGAGYRLSRNNDGVIELVGVDERTTDILNLCTKATLDPMLTLTSSSGLPGITDRTGIDTFEEGRSLFLSDLPSSFDIGLNLDFEYGILPYPKYDDQQENYYTRFNWNGGAICAIPYTAVDTETIGFCFEALVEASTDTSLDAYYEQKCKLHNSYDARCAEMLDILYANVVYDIGAILNIGGLDSALSGQMPGYYPNCPWSRFYNKSAEAAQTAIDEIMLSY